jgi:hypothetical protein
MIEPDTAGAPASGPLPERIVWTPEIERLNEFIVKSVRMQARGCAVMGQQTNGKSRAARFLVKLLPQTLGYSVAVVLWTIPQADKRYRKPRAWIQDRMIDSGCLAISHRDEVVLWHRLHAHLADMAIAAGSRWIVIIVDEAQNMLFSDYAHLITTFNKLELLNIKPFFMLIGQPELANAPAGWTEINGMQVIGRFFSRTYWFHGIAMEDIEHVLDSFDEPSRITPGARISADLMPQVLGTEWSIGRWAAAFIEALQILAGEHRVAGDICIPMQWLRSTLLLLLVEVTEAKLHPAHVSTAMVLEALRASEFFASQLGYYAKKPVESESPSESPGEARA